MLVDLASMNGTSPLDQVGQHRREVSGAFQCRARGDPQSSELGSAAMTIASEVLPSSGGPD